MVFMLVCVLQIDFEGQSTSGNLRLVESTPHADVGRSSVNVFRMKTTNEVGGGSGDVWSGGRRQTLP